MFLHRCEAILVRENAFRCEVAWLIARFLCMPKLQVDEKTMRSDGSRPAMLRASRDVKSLTVLWPRETYDLNDVRKTQIEFLGWSPCVFHRNIFQ